MKKRARHDKIVADSRRKSAIRSKSVIRSEGCAEGHAKEGCAEGHAEKSGRSGLEILSCERLYGGMGRTRKEISILMLVLALFLGACGGEKKEPEIVADYGSIQEAVYAQRDGADLKGKTIKVVASQDSAAGVIYFVADTKVKANLYVTIITDDLNRQEVLDIKKGDTAVVKVDTYDDHLKYSIYVYALEYELYKK